MNSTRRRQTMQERRYNPSENATKESLQLEEGEVYTLIFVVQKNASEKKIKKKKRMRLLKCYLRIQKECSTPIDIGISRSCCSEKHDEHRLFGHGIPKAVREKEEKKA